MGKLQKINAYDAAGMFLALEGTVSILMSTDQRPEANFSRFVRIMIGIGLALYEP